MFCYSSNEGYVPSAHTRLFHVSLGILFRYLCFACSNAVFIKLFVFNSVCMLLSSKIFVIKYVKFHHDVFTFATNSVRT